MRIEELRIGNKLDLYGTIATVQAEDFKRYIDDKKHFERFKPITLTDDWIYRCDKNCKRIEKSYRGVYYTFIIDGNLYYFFIDKKQVEKAGSHMIYKYIHSLQNLYFALTQKEITL